MAGEIEFETGHYLRFCSGGSEEPHRHRWRVRAVVQSDELDGNGLVMDFHELEKFLGQIVEPMQKVEMINELPEFAKCNPSAEQVARFVYDGLSARIAGRVTIQKVSVWETEKCCGSYRP